ncbi:very short patch repair endonuclease [Zhihengliuella salsuginis]|uniref:DUF559 domain-containing protein n=1 Tax=Zhihengliuella salsuginis TaxID=578222 RepID=A0ABQ3GK44_9MICC|nr:very short patch repair endonuclease [Zhihengliuella salsuginis]GHD06263.1 hypothetical protein GCM10008096_16050 [Zhihengliuella salsuginis]
MKRAESWASDAGTRRSMLGNKRRDTSIELAVRRRLHALGFRYRVDYPPVKGLRRRADVVFTRRRIAVFIDGCFWHRCPDHGTHPKRNADYWEPKLDANAARDAETTALLEAAGWTVLRFWAHEDPDDVVERIAAAVGFDRL